MIVMLTTGLSHVAIATKARSMANIANVITTIFIVIPSC